MKFYLDKSFLFYYYIPMKKTILVCIISCMVLVGLGWCGKKVEVQEDTIPQEQVMQQTASTTTKGPTKEQCIEVLKLWMEVVEEQMKGNAAKAQAIAMKVNNLQEQYHMDDEQFDTACQQYMTDPEVMKLFQ